MVKFAFESSPNTWTNISTDSRPVGKDETHWGILFQTTKATENLLKEVASIGASMVSRCGTFFLIATSTPIWGAVSETFFDWTVRLQYGKIKSNRNVSS